MKPTSVCVWAAVVTLGLCLSGCATPPHLPNTTPPLQLITAAEIQAMTPVEVVYEKRLSEYSVQFHTQDRRTIILGADIGAQEVWHFLYTLRPGQSCRLPDFFNNFVNAPNYSSVADITRMSPRIGTLVSRSPCSSTFTTPNGHYFSIGDPGSGAEVSHFIWSLADGECCRLPDAFLAWQKQQKTKPDKD